MQCWIICVTISVVMVACGAIISWMGRKKRELKTTLLILGGFVMLAVFFIRYPFLYIEADSKYFFEKIIDTAFKSFIHTMQTISLDEEYDVFFKFPDYIDKSAVFKTLLIIYTNILHFMAPVIGGAFILTILENVFPRIYIRTHPFREKFIFSELNLKSIALAEDVAEEGFRGTNGRIYHPLIVFTDVASCDQSLSSALLHRAKKIGAKCIEDSLSGFNLYFHSNNKPITYILIDEDEINNVSAAVEISKKFNGTKQKHVNVYVFSHQKEAELILDSIGKKNVEEDAKRNADQKNKKNTEDKSANKVKIRLIDEARTTIYQLLDKRPLFSEDPAFRGISLLVVGCGWMGREAVKAVAWCGQLGDKYPLKINVVDNIKQNIDELRFECPELFNPQNGYSISTKVINVKTKKFENFLENEAEHTTHVIVALGSDDLNINTATIIRSAFARLRLSDKFFESPVIHVLIENQAKSEQIEHMVDAGFNSLNIQPFGSIKERFTLDAAIHSTLDELARKTHLAYSEVPSADSSSDDYKKAIAAFEQIMYNQRSSYAAAVHIKYKLFAVGVRGLIKEEISPETIIKIAKKLKDEKVVLFLLQLEHTRWNAYMRSEGFRTPSIKELQQYFEAIGSHKNLLSQLHACMVPCGATNYLSHVTKENGKVIDCYDTGSNQIQAAWDILCQQVDNLSDPLDPRYDELDKMSLRVYKMKKQNEGFTFKLKDCNFKEFDLGIVKQIPEILKNNTGGQINVQTGTD